MIMMLRRLRLFRSRKNRTVSVVKPEMSKSDRRVIQQMIRELSLSQRATLCFHIGEKRYTKLVYGIGA